MFDKAILHIEGAHRIAALAAAFALLRAVFTVCVAMGLALAIVGVWNGEDVLSQLPWLGLFLGSFILRQICLALESRFIETFAGDTADSLMRSLLESVFASAGARIQEHGSASLAADAIEGVDNIENYLSLIVPKTIDAIVVPALLLLAMFILDWVSGLIALVCYPFIIIFMRLIGMSAGEEAAKRHAEFENMSNAFTDTAAGVDTLTAFGAADRFSNYIFQKSEDFREIIMKTLRIAMLSSTVLDLFATLALAAVAIMLGFRLVEGTVDFLPALAVLVMVPEYFRPIRELGNDYHASLDGREAMAAINEFTKASENAAVAPFDPLSTSNISTLEICTTKSKKIGVFGDSGAGKTTLLNIVAGFVDPDPSTSITINGEKAATLRTPNWQRKVAYIPQDPYIFHASLRDNLVFYAPDASDEKIERAVRSVGLERLVSQLPKGLDTQLGRGAREVSGGEAQRIALCRAILDPERTIWVLDEPTAHVDAETEQQLKEFMLPLMEDKLVFLATHRMHWVQNMDECIYLGGSRA